MLRLRLFKGVVLYLRGTYGHVLALLITPDLYEKFPVLHIHLC